MRKLGLLGALGAILGLALLLESLVTHLPSTWGEAASRRVVVVLGRSGPQRIPSRPPAEPGRTDPLKARPADSSATIEGRQQGRSPSLSAPAVVPEAGEDSPAPRDGPRTYRVRPGDTLSDIALRLLGDDDRWPEIGELNGLANPRDLRAGTDLRIPTR